MLQMKENEQHYEVDFVAMERCFAAGAKCLLFCNPHNPGGKAWKKEELAEILRLCQKYDIRILSDDVHCDWVFAPWGYTSLLSLPDAAERTVMVTSPSKTFNVAGLCVSNLIVPDPDLRACVQRELDAMFIKGPNLFGYVGTAAAYLGAEAWAEEAKAYVKDNIDYARECLEREAPRLRLFDAESTFMLWIDCRQMGAGSEEICASLAKDYGITVNNGSAYGLGGSGFIRMNVACPRSMLKTGVEALIRWHQDVIKEQ